MNKQMKQFRVVYAYNVHVDAEDGDAAIDTANDLIANHLDAEAIKIGLQFTDVTEIKVS